MLLKQLKDSQRHQRQPKQVQLFLQSGGRGSVEPAGGWQFKSEQTVLALLNTEYKVHPEPACSFYFSFLNFY